MKAPLAVAIHHGSQLRSTVGVDFTDVGKQENPEKNPGSMGENNYNNSTLTHLSFKFLRINTGLLYTQAVTHSAITPSNWG